jgi:hypothetical protein
MINYLVPTALDIEPAAVRLMLKDTPAFIDPATDTGGIAPDDSMCRHITGHHGPGGHHSKSAYPHTVHDYCASTNGAAYVEQCLRIRVQGLTCARVPIVDKRGIGPDKDVIFDPQSIPEINATLDGNIITKDDLMLNKGMAVDIAVIPYTGTFQDNRMLPHLCMGTDMRGVHLGRGVDHGRNFLNSA